MNGDSKRKNFTGNGRRESNEELHSSYASIYDEGYEKITISVEEGTEERADSYLAKATGLSRSSVQKLIAKGLVTHNGVYLQKSCVARGGDTFETYLTAPEPSEALPENIPLDVVYEDRDIIVINKPQGMVVHPAPGHSSGTLVSALLYHCGDSLSGIGGVLRPGIVHRIDKDTAGLICAAKNDSAHLSLAAQLEDHSMRRTYEAILCGRLPEESGKIDAPIGRHPKDRKKMAVIKGGRSAVTHYRALEEYRGFTLAEMKLETGRTHQIRVHTSHIGRPVLGDPIYGGVTQFEKRHPSICKGQFLFAKELCLAHPSTGERMTFQADLPDNFKEAVRLLRQL